MGDLSRTLAVAAIVGVVVAVAGRLSVTQDLTRVTDRQVESLRGNNRGF